MEPPLSFLLFYLAFYISNSLLRYTSEYSKWISIAIFALIFLSTVSLNYPNKMAYIKSRTTINYEGLFSYNLMYEINASLWLYKNYYRVWVKPSWFSGHYEGVNTRSIVLHDNLTEILKTRIIEIPIINYTIIISDPFTMYMIESITGLKQIIPERAFIYEFEYSNESLSLMSNLRKILLYGNSFDIYHKILNLVSKYYKYKHVLIIISERTIAWLHTKKQFVNFIPKPVNVTVRSIISKLSDPRYFKLVYNIRDKLYIYELVTPPINVSRMLMSKEELQCSWTLSTWGKGNISVILVNNSKLIISKGTKKLWLVTAGFKSLDVSNFTHLALRVYGNNSNLELRLILWGSKDKNSKIWIDFRFLDNFKGWRTFIFDLRHPFSRGSRGFDSSNVWRIGIMPSYRSVNKLNYMVHYRDITIIIGPIEVLRLRVNNK